VQIGETPLSVGEGRRAAGLKPLCLPRTHSLEEVCNDILSVVSEVDNMIGFFESIRGLHFSNMLVIAVKSISFRIIDTCIHTHSITLALCR